MTPEAGIVTDARRVAVELARPAAESVDRDARFPAEAVDGLREAKLLSAMVPAELGGLGAGLPDVARATRELAAECASTALVFAMHQIEIAYLARHGHTDGLRTALREAARDQLLFANGNSEAGVGGDVGRSVCAIERSDGRFRLEKNALAISYGAHADGVIATARSSPDAADTEQVLVLCRPPGLTLEQTSVWNTTGLRGTCSNGFRLIAEQDESLIFPDPFAEIVNRTGTAVTQVLLGSVWWGLAESAAATAHSFVRARSRRNVDELSLGAFRLSELSGRLQSIRELMIGTAERYEQVKDTDQVAGWNFGLALRNLKVSSSETAVDIVTRALAICGIAGYSRESPYSLDRILRDVHGGPIMISNDRFHELNARVLTVLKHL